MNNRRIALGLGTGAGALLGAALLSGLASPIAAADDYAVLPIPVPTGADYTNPETVATMPAFGGLGTDTISEEFLANYDTGVDGTSTPVLADVTGATTAATGEAGEEEELINTYSNPLFTDTSTDITGIGSLAGNTGVETDTLLIDPSQLGSSDFGISVESVPGVDGAAPTVTEDLITPLGNIPLGDDLTSLLGGTDLSSLLGGDLLAGLDPSSLLSLF
jgi:hypothetical protein